MHDGRKLEIQVNIFSIRSHIDYLKESLYEVQQIIKIAELPEYSYDPIARRLSRMETSQDRVNNEIEDIVMDIGSYRIAEELGVICGNMTKKKENARSAANRIPSVTNELSHDYGGTPPND